GSVDRGPPGACGGLRARTCGHRDRDTDRAAAVPARVSRVCRAFVAPRRHASRASGCRHPERYSLPDSCAFAAGARGSRVHARRFPRVRGGCLAGAVAPDVSGDDYRAGADGRCGGSGRRAHGGHGLTRRHGGMETHGVASAVTTKGTKITKTTTRTAVRLAAEGGR